MCYCFLFVGLLYREEKEDPNGKMQVVRAYQVALEQFLPLLLAELTFCTEFFEFSEKNLNGITNISSIVKVLSSNNPYSRVSGGTDNNGNAMSQSEKVTLMFAEKMIKSMFNQLLSEFSELIDRADRMDKFNTLHMLIVTERTLHTYQLESDFLASFLTQLQQKLAMLWNKFISNQVDWIQSNEKKVKQAGVLVPFQKFPPFCYQMYQIIITANRSVKSLLYLDLPSKKRIEKRNSSMGLILGGNGNGNGGGGSNHNRVVSNDIEAAFKMEYKSDIDDTSPKIQSHKSNESVKSGGYQIKIDSAINRQPHGRSANHDLNGRRDSVGSLVGADGSVIEVVESEHVSMTIHKMTTALFHWLGQQANADRKYRSACLMENYHYFYIIFSKTDGVRALDEHVHKAKKEYRHYFREYVRWCVKYECESLVQCWDKLNHQVQTNDDLEVVSVFVPYDSIKKVIKEFFDSGMSLCCFCFCFCFCFQFNHFDFLFFVLFFVLKY